MRKHRRVRSTTRQLRDARAFARRLGEETRRYFGMAQLCAPAAGM
jgi:hypothetical protein